ncbi:MAG TPA: alpha/beta fold hydrolase [Acidimicrobiales bacterium]|nr:alpha/beta fold hydrolase [Acidimicrobiales bacterium]
MPVPLTLVHSPLVGPETWQTLVPALEDRGHRVVVADLTPALAAGAPFAEQQIELIGRAAGRQPTVLVGHSGAGPLLAAAADACGAAAIGCVFVDAGLPTPGRNWFEVVPPELAAAVRSMAEDGWLPPWSEWWAPEELAELIPDPQLREGFTAACPRLPVALFEEPLPGSPDWAERPGAYLRLSEAYKQEAGRARELGWPVGELDGHHLSVLSQPERVIGPLLDLVAQLQA